MPPRQALMFCCQRNRTSEHTLKLSGKLLAANSELIQAAVESKSLRVEDDAFEIGVVIDGLIVGIDQMPHGKPNVWQYVTI